MKIKSEYILKKIATEFIVVPTGQESVNFNGIISLNGSGALLFETLQKGATRDVLEALLLDTYNVSKEQANIDLEAFLETIRTNGLLI